MMPAKSSGRQEGGTSIQMLSVRKIWAGDEVCEKTDSFIRKSCSVGIFVKTGSFSFTETVSAFFNFRIQ